MIDRIPDTKNGYQFHMDSTAADWKGLCDTIYAQRGRIKCIICNSEMSKMFRVGILGTNIVTVNNSLKNGQVYFDRIS